MVRAWLDAQLLLLGSMPLGLMSSSSSRTRPRVAGSCPSSNKLGREERRWTEEYCAAGLFRLMGGVGLFEVVREGGMPLDSGSSCPTEYD